MWRWGAAACFVIIAHCVAAQDSAAVPTRPVLVVEFDRLFNESQQGGRIRAALEDERRALVAENQRIEEELTEEERDLTAQRATLEPAEFRRLAEAFDAKVTALRAAQDDKARTLTQEAERRQQGFFQEIRPILEALMIEAQADVLIERGSTLLVRDRANVTDLAISRIDAGLGVREP